MAQRTVLRKRGQARARDGGVPAEVDRLVHEPVRLGILGALAANSSLSFSEVKGLLGITDGNLSVHARKLEEAGYIRCRKSFAGKVPLTEYALSPLGKRSLERYLDGMDFLIRSLRRR
jgi:DNA-binding transcriptional ArsR family regulator